MIVMTDYKAIIAFSVFAMLALAGSVVFVADDASADEVAAGPYKVTYKDGESSIVDKTDANGAYTFKNFDAVGFTAPEGYEFKNWKDASSSTIYQAESSYNFGGDVAVVPVYELKADYSKIVLTYGSISESYLVGSESLVLSEKQLTDFGKKIGMEFIVTEGTISLKDAENFKFNGFIKDDAESKITTLSGIVGVSTEEVSYALDVEPIYKVTFVINGASTSPCLSTELVVPKNPSVANYDFVGWSDGTNIYKPAPGADVVDLSQYQFTADTAFTAEFEPKVYDATFIIGDKTEVRSAKYNYPVDAVPLPEGYAYYALADDETKTKVDFPYTVLGPVTFVAVPGTPAEVFNVTFQIEGKTDVVLKSDNISAIPDTARDGYEFQGWVVKGTTSYVDPLTYTYTADVTFVAMYKVAGPATNVYTVIFKIDGKADVVQKSDSLTIPNTDREGYEFQGWVVEGTSAYVDPSTYQYVSDVTFVAMYKQIGFSKVTFVIGEETVEVSVKNGTAVPADKVPALDSAVYSGWDKDVSAIIDADTEFTAVLVVYHTVTFDFGAGFSALNKTVEVADGALIDKEQIPAIPLQMGDVMWSMDFEVPVTSDVTAVLVPVVYPEEPGFFETTSGQIALVVIVIVVLGAVALAVAPASPMNYKLVKGKLDAAKAAKEAKKKP